jgi:hypothetical protein
MQWLNLNQSPQKEAPLGLRPVSLRVGCITHPMRNEGPVLQLARDGEGRRLASSVPPIGYAAVFAAPSCQRV